MSRLSLARHKETGFAIDTKRGVVYGSRGKSIGRRNKYGYVEIRQLQNGIHRSYHAHRLVWEAANGPLQPGQVVDHINGLKHDNRLTNLLAVTQLDNVRDGYAKAKGAALHLAPPVWRAVVDTWGLKTAAEWAEELGLSEAQVHGIRLANNRECSAFAKAGRQRKVLLPPSGEPSRQHGDSIGASCG